jgi:hypothetical protein
MTHEPKLWRDMTREEKGAIRLAHRLAVRMVDGRRT